MMKQIVFTILALVLMKKNNILFHFKDILGNAENIEKITIL